MLCCEAKDTHSSASHRVSALEEQSVIGNEHFPFERSIERAHVDEIFVWKKTATQTYTCFQ